MILKKLNWQSAREEIDNEVQLIDNENCDIRKLTISRNLEEFISNGMETTAHKKIVIEIGFIETINHRPKNRILE